MYFTPRTIEELDTHSEQNRKINPVFLELHSDGQMKANIAINVHIVLHVKYIQLVNSYFYNTSFVSVLAYLLC